VNQDVQPGTGDNTDYTSPVHVLNLTGVAAIKTGERFALALKSYGSVWAWGHNVNGQLGNGNFTASNIPVQVLGLTNVVKIAVGGYHCFAMKSDSTWWAWGNNLLGQLGMALPWGVMCPLQ
jgi:alpha-tubulin suppressor-like RCC1 family protein